MSNIKSILDELASDNSRLAKEAILSRERNNSLLRGVIYHALSPYINYYQKKIPEYTSCVDEDTAMSLDAAINLLGMLATRNVTGNAAVEYLRNILQNCDDDDAVVIERIVKRDLECGVHRSTAEKIWPGLIPTFDVMTCHKDISGIRYPALAQTKMDGARVNVHFNGLTVTAFSRAGKEFHLKGALDKAAHYFMEPEMVLDGELLFLDDKGKILDRKTSNGIANKATKGTITDEEASRVIFVMWDIVDFAGTIRYEDRFGALQKAMEKKAKEGVVDNFRLVESELVQNEASANAFYKKQRAAGHEGAIIKNLDGKWTATRSKDCGKMKAIEEADLIVTGWEYGTGKNKHRMGNLNCETADGKLKVNVGSGFSDKDRDNGDLYVGKIVSVLYNEIIKNKGSDTYSLFLPRLSEVRFDKKVANKFEDLK